MSYVASEKDTAREHHACFKVKTNGVSENYISDMEMSAFPGPQLLQSQPGTLRVSPAQER